MRAFIPTRNVAVAVRTNNGEICCAVDDLAVPCGGKKVFKAVLTRRDLSNWDPVAQDWVMSKYPKRVFVGSSSRKLLLKGILVGTDGGGY